MSDRPNKLIMVSGGFDPLHVGHVQLMENAAQYGDLLVVVNSDEWLLRKKGYVFMPYTERLAIIGSMRCVHQVMCAMDSDDDTVIEDIRRFEPDYFANGGDRTKKNVPEQAICDEMCVEMLWGIGGEDKPQSSSWLVQEAFKSLFRSEVPTALDGPIYRLAHAMEMNGICGHNEAAKRLREVIIGAR